MPVYVDVLMLLNFLVDLLLLVGTNRLAGYPVGAKRAVLAAVLGGLYGGLCVMPGFTFLSGTFWRLMSLLIMGGISFGFRVESFRRTGLFALLSMALGGAVSGMSGGGFWSLVLSAVGICGICLVGLRGRLGRQYVTVQVENCRFTALVDTGNTLTDPLTGQQIMVVSPTVGRRLLQTDEQVFAQPLKAMERIPGLRLIPYHAVGCSGGVLPAKRFADVRIGSRRGSCLIAFAPNELGRGEAYEALMGGVL